MGFNSAFKGLINVSCVQR